MKSCVEVLWFRNSSEGFLHSSNTICGRKDFFFSPPTHFTERQEGDVSQEVSVYPPPAVPSHNSEIWGDPGISTPEIPWIFIFTLLMPLISNLTHRALLIPFPRLGNSRYKTKTRFEIFIRILANLQTLFSFFYSHFGDRRVRLF